MAAPALHGSSPPKANAPAASSALVVSKFVALASLLLVAVLAVLATGAAATSARDRPLESHTRLHDLAYVLLVGWGSIGQGMVRVVDDIKTKMQPWTPGDVLLFHTGEFELGTPFRTNFSSMYPDVQFHRVPTHAWQLPPGMKESDLRKGKQGVGYRHMCRWYSMGLFKYLDQLGYRWVLRLDSDSQVLSEVQHNMVRWMEDNKKQYGFRLWEGADIPDVTWSLAELTAWYLTAMEIQPKWLYERCNPPNITGLNSYGGWNSTSVYNNMFMANVSFWVSPEVESYMDAVIRSRGIYLFRWGDAQTHTFVISIFLDKAQVHQFNFAYRHQLMAAGKEAEDVP